MTDKTAISLAALIVLFIGLDALLLDWTATAYLMHKLIDAIRFLAFWR